MSNQKKVFNPPLVISMAALLSAWVAIILILQGNLYLSFAFALLAFILDSMDGYVARRLNISSNFGRLLDSQIDVFIYLVYPAIAFYNYFSLDNIVYIFIIFLFLASGVFRLARFNDIGYVAGFSYPGLPVVFSHVLILLFILLQNVAYFECLAGLLIIITSILMLCSFPFPKPKKPQTLIIFLSLLILFMLYLNFL